MTGPQFGWAQALTAMTHGGVVRRARDMIGRSVPLVGEDGEEIHVTEYGVEAVRVATAVTITGEFVQVFQGADSKCLFEPSEDDMQATDWVSVTHDRSLW